MKARNYAETKAIRMQSRNRDALDKVKDARTALFRALQSAATNNQEGRDIAAAYDLVNRALLKIVKVNGQKR